MKTFFLLFVSVRLNNDPSTRTLFKGYPLEKDRVISAWFTNKINVVAAMDGSRLLLINDVFTFNVIPDTVCGKKY